jgi:adenylate kinase
MRPAPWEYLRLAIPRRMYTDNHLAYAAEVVTAVWAKRDAVPECRPRRSPPTLAHFTAVLEPVPVAHDGRVARRILFLAPPGGGKSTQARRLAARLDVPYVASGDLLREHVTEGTPLGRRAAPFIESGDLVPDDVVTGMVEERLGRPDAAGGFVLDGFPRHVAQAAMLDRRFGGRAFDVVFQLTVPADEIVRRLAGRRICPNGHVFNVHHGPPAVPGRCDACGLPLTQRDDDREDVARRRLAVYQERTAPLRGRAREQGVLVEIDGSGTPDDVAERLAASVR